MRLKFSGPRSALITLNQVWLGLPVGRFQSGSTCQIATAVDWLTITVTMNMSCVNLISLIQFVICRILHTFMLCQLSE